MTKTLNGISIFCKRSKKGEAWNKEDSIIILFQQ